MCARRSRPARIDQGFITVVMGGMKAAEPKKVAESKLTAQAQISVPAEVRRRLGLAPGSVLEWVEENGKMTVRRAGKYTCDDIHKAAFPKGPPKYVADPRKEGVEAYVRKRYARD